MATDDELRVLARELWHDKGQIEIDDNATISHNDEGTGAYVAAWVWVDFLEDGEIPLSLEGPPPPHPPTGSEPPCCECGSDFHDCQHCPVFDELPEYPSCLFCSRERDGGYCVGCGKYVCDGCEYKADLPDDVDFTNVDERPICPDCAPLPEDVELARALGLADYDVSG